MPNNTQYNQQINQRQSTTSYETLFYDKNMVTQYSGRPQAVQVKRQNDVTEFKHHVQMRPHHSKQTSRNKSILTDPLSRV